MKRIALPVSIVLILASWIPTLWTHLLQPGEVFKPSSVGVLALMVSINFIIVLGPVWLLLWANGERLSDLGMRRQDVQQALPRGLLLGLGLFVVMNFVVNSLVSSLMGGETDETIQALFRDPREAPLWLFCALVGGGFTEELSRAFVLTRFERAFGRYGLMFAIVVDSVVFGLGHLYQGPAAVVTTGLTGALFAIIFLWRRRVADAMVAHATFDVLGVIVAYFLYAH